MKKGILVTLYDDSNYGNKLQNYAVYRLLTDRGIDIVNIKNNRHLNYINQNYLKAHIKFYLSKIKYYIKKRNCYGLKYYKYRKNNFKNFSKQIKTSKHYFSYNSILKYDNNDYLFVGSDQVWNPYMALDDLSLFNGFKNGIKVSISASFGVSKIDNKTTNRIKKSLEDFAFISVREKDGKKIVDSLGIDKKCHLLVDPTMAIERKVWENQAKKPFFEIKCDYILLAFLGRPDEKLIQQINEFATKKGLDVIDIYKKNSYYTSCGPSEFLYLEKNASLICTDSFHASVFGIIFNTPILVTGRNGTKENMNSRIDTLLNKFNLESRKYNGLIEEDVFDTDYSESNKILNNEKNKYEHYLDEIITNERN